MSKLFSRFGKSPHSQATLSPQSASNDSPVRTGSMDSPRSPPTPASPSPLRSVQHPRVILTSEASDAATTPTSPGSLHRQSSMGTSLEDIPRKNSLSAAQRQAFADQVARSSGVTVADDMQTPRAAAPSSPPQSADQHSTPKANGLRPSPSSEFKSPSTPAQDSPSMRKQPSAASLTAPPPAARSRRGSVASSDAGSTRGRVATQVPSPLPLVESPTSEKPLFASPRSSTDAARSPTRSTKSKQKSRTGWRSRGASGSAGGIAGALAHSGMSLAHPINPNLIAPPAPPVPSKQPTRASTGIPRSPSDTSLAYGGGGTLSKTTSRTRSRGGHESSDSDAYDSEDALSFGPDEIPITGFAVASSKRNADFHELFPNVPDGDYLIEGEPSTPRYENFNLALGQIMGVRCSVRSSSKAGFIYPRTTCALTQTSLAGSQT